MLSSAHPRLWEFVHVLLKGIELKLNGNSVRTQLAKRQLCQAHSSDTNHHTIRMQKFTDSFFESVLRRRIHKFYDNREWLKF